MSENQDMGLWASLDWVGEGDGSGGVCVYGLDKAVVVCPGTWAPESASVC